MIATQDLIHALPWPVCCLDAEGKHRFANRAYESLCGQSMSDIIGRSLLQVWPGEVGLRLEFDRSDMMKQGGARRTEELWALPEADRWFDVRWSAAPLQDGPGLILAAHDIDRQVRAVEEARLARQSLENAVRERTAALEAANEELESFGYSVSHDLRAPLRAIEGFGELLLDESATPEERRAWLGEVLSGIRHMNQLLADLLKLARLDRQAMAQSQVNLTELCHRCIARIESDRPGRPTRWTVPQGLALTADEGLLELAMHNLLDNAHKFTRQQESPHVAVELRPLESGQVLVEVVDNGVGFDMAQSGRLFGAFQRLHSSADFPGTGIGLAIVRRIARRHGGRALAHSQRGQGSRFGLLLPADL